MSIIIPAPDALDDYLLSASVQGEQSGENSRRESLKLENAIATRFWGGFQLRIVLTFVTFALIWMTAIALALNGIFPLWVGLILNTFIASTFYMPMHEAVHKNIWGRQSRGRRFEDIIGMLCSIPLGFSFVSHRASHMKHHAYTNDPDRDPDHFTDGPYSEMPLKWLSTVVIYALLPLIAFVPASRRVVHPRLRRSMAAGGDKRDGLTQLRFWAVTHGVLIIAFVLGFGWPALLLWYVPARLQAFWLLTIFAWYPHHPANKTGRYVDTRVAVFPGSRVIIRGHDHHALHHLFPRVPHYNLPKLWRETASDLVAKGVRVEGRALEATGPIVW